MKLLLASNFLPQLQLLKIPIQQLNSIKIHQSEQWTCSLEVVVTGGIGSMSSTSMTTKVTKHIIGKVMINLLICLKVKRKFILKMIKS